LTRDKVEPAIRQRSCATTLRIAWESTS